MRLLDSVARCFSPLAVPSGTNPAQVQLAGPSRFAAQIAACPLRFVLGDDLTQASADLAFADGARLVGCLDLLRMPAPHLWIEWNDEVHKRVIHETRPSAQIDSRRRGTKGGHFAARFGQRADGGRTHFLGGCGRGRARRGHAVAFGNALRSARRIRGFQ